MNEEIITNKINGTLYPITKYYQERIEIKNHIFTLLSQKKSSTISMFKCKKNIFLEIENELKKKSFLELEKKEQKIVLGDIHLLTEEAFHYYIFEIIIFLYENEFILADIVVQKLFSIINKEKLRLFTKEEIKLIIAFFQNLIDEINQVKGDIELFNELEEWEKKEVFHPLKGWEEKMKHAIRNLNSYFNITNQKIKLEKSLDKITKQYQKSKVNVYIPKHEENIRNFFSTDVELQKKGLKGIQQLLNIRLWDEVLSLTNMGSNYPNYYRDIFIDDFNNFDEWYTFLEKIVKEVEIYQNERMGV